MAAKKKNSSRSRPPEATKARVPQKPPVDRKLRLNLGVKLKEEIFGLLTMAISVLVILSVVTHRPLEQPGSIMDLWRAGQLQNLLGIVGAYLSYYLMSYTFGYALVALPILFLVYGWLFFTHKSIFLVNQFAFYIVTLMVLTSAWLAIPGAIGQMENWDASGFLGGMLAHQLYVWLGGFGAAAIWVVFSLVWIIMVTRVSIADLIPAIQNIFLSSYRSTAETISKFRNRQQELLDQGNQKRPAETVTEKPFVPLYLQNDTEPANPVQSAKDTTQAAFSVNIQREEDLKKDEVELKPAISEPKPEEKPIVKPPITGDLALDTQFMRDLKAIGHIDKKFSINGTRLAELQASAGHTDTEEKKTPEKEQEVKPPVFENEVPKTIDGSVRQTEIAPSEQSAMDMGDLDFKDLAKNAFDEEHAHIDIREPEPVPDIKQTTPPAKIENVISPTGLMFNEETEREEKKPEPVPHYDIPAEEAVAVNDVDKPSVKLERAKSSRADAAKADDVNFDQENQQARKRYKFPSIDLLEPTQQMEKLTPEEIHDLDKKVHQIIEKLSEFGIDTRVVATEYGGPVVAIYQLELPSGLKISKITGLEDELALSLKVKSVRMVPVTSKGTIQVEIPKPKASPVLIRSLFEDPLFRNAKQKYRLGLALGKTIDGHIHFEDLAKMPHLLIAGTTGSGKSVGINSIITSILYQFDPSEVKFIMVDPKKVELALYRRLKNHHLISLCNHRGEIIEDVITKPENAKLILKALVEEMESRYEKLAEANVRNIDDYNTRWKEGRMPEDGKFKHYKMEYIVAIIDELADLMMTAPREVETSITRLAQMARAVGIHLIVATQRPSVDVLTGLIKANFPARIAYAVRSKIDSRTILDMGGAEQLLGKGDMLFMPPGQNPIRIQNAFTSTLETETIVDYINRMPAFPRKDFMVKEESKEGDGEVDSSNFDELYNQALEIVVKNNQGSASLLQRRLAIGYARAARIIDQLEKAGVVGAQDGGKPRPVLISDDQVPMYLN